MDLMKIMEHRRSIRKYTGESISDEQIEAIAKAGLLSASGRRIRPWEIIVVTDKDILGKLAECRVGAAKMLEKAAAAFVVVADSSKADTWIEDSSIVMANMHLMADSLGLGSCWIQGRMRDASDGSSTEEYVRNLVGFPKEYSLLAILSVGVADEHPAPYTELPVEKIHYGKF